MAKNNDAGLYQDKNGMWYYRIKMAKDANGNKVDLIKKTDGNGLPFRTKTACKRARDKKLVLLQEKGTEKKETYPATLQEIWELFLEKDAKKKAQATVTKYTSVWKNHIEKRYGKKKLKDLRVSDLEAVLVDGLDAGLAYAYVESFLKLFYLLFGIAYREEKMEPNQYTRMFLDRGTRLAMPPKRTKEESENRVFHKYELEEIFSVVKGTNLETAFMFGYYCGLRVGEVFGLFWSDIDWNREVIAVQRQMNYEDGCHCVGPVKTLAGYREVELPKVLLKHLLEKYRRQEHAKETLSYRNTERVLDKTKVKAGVPLIGGDFINRKENGELLTYNSVKFYSKKIKAETSVEDFKFHSLRKTHLTELAAMNTPAHVLMVHAGHKKISTTMKYYLGQDEDSRLQLKRNVNQLNTTAPYIEVADGDGTVHSIREEDYLKMLELKRSIPTVRERECPYQKRKVS